MVMTGDGLRSTATKALCGFEVDEWPAATL